MADDSDLFRGALIVRDLRESLETPKALSQNTLTSLLQQGF